MIACFTRRNPSSLPSIDLVSDFHHHQHITPQTSLLPATFSILAHTKCPGLVCTLASAASLVSQASSYSRTLKLQDGVLGVGIVDGAHASWMAP